MMSRALAALCLLLLLLTSCAPPGVRLLHVEYRQGDQVVLTTYYEDPDARRAPDVRTYLATRPIMCEDVSGVIPATADPLRAVLGGPVQIEVLHANTSLRTEQLEDLTLVRDDAVDHRWYLPAEQLERLVR